MSSGNLQLPKAPNAGNNPTKRTTNNKSRNIFGSSSPVSNASPQSNTTPKPNNNSTKSPNNLNKPPSNNRSKNIFGNPVAATPSNASSTSPPTGNTLGKTTNNASKRTTNNLSSRTTNNKNRPMSPNNAANYNELISSSNGDLLGLEPTANIKGKNTGAAGEATKNETKSLFGDLFTPTPSGPGPAQGLVSTTETAIKSASNKISEVSSGVSNRLSEISSGDSNLWMNILKIVIVILILVALFFVAKYLFVKYTDSIYSSPYLLEGIKNGKHALVISQDPANPSYVPMPKSDNQDSLQLTYDFWFLIDSYEYKKGEWKHMFHKGNSSSYPNRAPGVWLHPDTNAMRIYMNTQDNILEYVDVDNLPLRKWIHCSIIINDLDMDVYINGYLKKRQKLTSVPKLNNGDFWVSMFGGFEGFLAKIRYYAKAISVDEIAANVRAGPGDSACIDTGQTPPYLDDDWWVS